MILLHGTYAMCAGLPFLQGVSIWYPFLTSKEKRTPRKVAIQNPESYKLLTVDSGFVSSYKVYYLIIYTKK